jgi:tetratricopeptide (TPR) repeat protein
LEILRINQAFCFGHLSLENLQSVAIIFVLWAMNFLSHYYLLPEKANSDMVIGNLLPDLMRGFTKVYRKEIKNNPSIQGTEILAGIHYHLQTDALFHEQDFFINHCQNIKAEIQRKQLPQTRSFIVAHVMVELLIDQYLMEEEDKLAPLFYQTLENSNNNNLQEKLNITLNRQNSSKIITSFKGFIESKHAYTLQSDDGIVNALYHIIGKRIGENFKSPYWLAIVKEAKGQIKEDLPNFLQNLKEALRDA